MKIIDGKKIADQILDGLKNEIDRKNLQPCLAAVLVGDDPASHLYLRKKEGAAQKVGIEIRKHSLPAQTSEKEVLDLINSLNQDDRIDGILVQLPLPSQLTADKIIQAIEPVKDVDGFVKESRFESPFILAIWQALVATGQKLNNKKIIALVNSDIFGRALKLYLKGLKVDYLLGFENKFLTDLKEADVLISALGRPALIKGEMIKEGTILIDGGISRVDNKVVGDVDRKDIQGKAGWLTPAPGGLGPLTVAFLLKNVILASQLNL